MDILNINNMLTLKSVAGAEKRIKEVVVGGRPLLYTYGSWVSSCDGDIFEAIGMLLFSPQIAELRQSDIRQTDISDHPKSDIATSLLIYLNSLPQDIYQDIEVRDYSLVFGRRIDSKQYLSYMKDSDVLLAAMLHQFLDHRFMTSPRELMSLDVLVTRLMNRVADVSRGAILQHLFKLYALGFVRVIPATEPAVFEKTGKQEERLVDRFAIASFISGNIDAGKEIKVISDTFSVSIDPLNGNNLVIIKGYFMDMLKDPQNVAGIVDEDSLSVPAGFDGRTIRLLMFAGIKQLHLKFFRDWHNEEKEFHIIELKTSDYLRYLHIYKMSGMDMVDIAILSQLKIKKMPLSEICGKLNYADAEVYRSVFAMTILGLVSPGARHTGTQEIHHGEKQSAVTVTPAPNKSLMGMLLEKIKFK